MSPSGGIPALAPTSADPALYPEVVEFRLLGRLEVASGEHHLAIRGPKQRAFLAALLLNPNRFVSADRLVEAVWSGTPPPSAAHSLEVYASQLRRSLGEPDRLLHRGGAYLLRVEEGERDIDLFERLILEGRAALAAGAL